jgi:predicted phosphodiesterase
VHDSSVPQNDLYVEQGQEEKVTDKTEDFTEITPAVSNINSNVFPLKNVILGELLIQDVVMTPSEDATKGFGITFHSNEQLEEPSILILNENLSLVQSYAVSVEAIDIGDPSKTMYVYKAEITGLEPNKTYQYIIKAKEAYSNLYAFTGIKQTDPITIAFFGDTQGYKLSQYEDFAANYKVAMKTVDRVDISLIAGDIVDTGDSSEQWGYFHETMKETLASSLFATAIGNHDAMNGSKLYQYNFRYPTNGIKGLEERNYYFDLPGARVAIWDTESPKRFDEQGAWLSRIMSESNQDYHIVLMHRSAYPMVYDEGYIRALSTIMEEAGVDLVLSGHDHVYSRTTMWQNKVSEVGKGVTYIVGGSSSGSKVYKPKNIEKRYWKQFAYEGTEPVFTLISISKGLMHIQAYANKDNHEVLIDTINIPKR